MVLPAFLAALGLTEAVWIAVLGIIRLLSWIGGIVLVSSYIRDAVTKVTEEQVTATQNDTIETILARTDLTAAQKEALIRQYLNLQDTGFFDNLDTGKIILIAAGILGLAYVLGGKK